MRHLHSPTLAQWGCRHRWKTTTSRLGNNDVVRMRYLTCQRCGLRVKTEERLVVPWDASDLVTQVKALLPERKAVVLWDTGITELPLGRLNAQLEPRGYVIHASKGPDSKRQVACFDEDGRVKRYGLFRLRPTSPQGLGCMDREQSKG